MRYIRLAGVGLLLSLFGTAPAAAQDEGLLDALAAGVRVHATAVMTAPPRSGEAPSEVILLPDVAAALTGNAAERVVAAPGDRGGWIRVGQPQRDCQGRACVYTGPAGGPVVISSYRRAYRDLNRIEAAVEYSYVDRTRPVAYICNTVAEVTLQRESAAGSWVVVHFLPVRVC